MSNIPYSMANACLVVAIRKIVHGVINKLDGDRGSVKSLEVPALTSLDNLLAVGLSNRFSARLNGEVYSIDFLAEKLIESQNIFVKPDSIVDNLTKQLAIKSSNFAQTMSMVSGTLPEGASLFVQICKFLHETDKVDGEYTLRYDRFNEMLDEVTTAYSIAIRSNLDVLTNTVKPILMETIDHAKIEVQANSKIASSQYEDISIREFEIGPHEAIQNIFVGSFGFNVEAFNKPTKLGPRLNVRPLDDSMLGVLVQEALKNINAKEDLKLFLGTVNPEVLKFVYDQLFNSLEMSNYIASSLMKTCPDFYKALVLVAIMLRFVDNMDSIDPEGGIDAAKASLKARSHFAEHLIARYHASIDLWIKSNTVVIDLNNISLPQLYHKPSIVVFGPVYKEWIQDNDIDYILGIKATPNATKFTTVEDLAANGKRFAQNLKNTYALDKEASNRIVSGEKTRLYRQAISKAIELLKETDLGKQCSRSLEECMSLTNKYLSSIVIIDEKVAYRIAYNLLNDLYFQETDLGLYCKLLDDIYVEFNEEHFTSDSVYMLCSYRMLEHTLFSQIGV